MKESDAEWLKKRAVEAVEHLKQIGQCEDARPLARAYAKGIPATVATDVEDYLKMALEEIASEWNIEDPVDLLAVLSAAFFD